MKQFQIFRYLKNLRYMIVIVTLLGSLGIYWYAEKKQSYTAQTIIKYSNATATEGKAPDGSPIDPKEIYSAAVITDVIYDLGLSSQVDYIRSMCSVTEIITEDEQRRKDAVLDKGEEYTDFSPTYKVTLKAGSESSGTFVRKVLDSIINNYFVFYSKKYIDSAVIPNNVLNVSPDAYDYINCIELIENSVAEIDEYLENKKNYYPNFRSARTGYSFEDLQERYRYINENNVPALYAVVFGERLTKNKEALVKNYENRRIKAILKISNLADHIKKERGIIDQFGDKVTQSQSQVAGAIGDNTDAIIRDVENNRRKLVNVDTTYDDLIDYYVSLCSDQNQTQIERDYCQKVLSTFNNANVQDDYASSVAVEMVTDLSEVMEQLNVLYDEVEATSEELNEYSGAQNISTLTGTYVDEAINIELYMIMAFLLFLVVGCVGAVLLGRLGDFWDYFINTDKKTGIANRIKCDEVIEQYSKSMLDDYFSCIVFNLTYLQSANASNGRRIGDELLKNFGSIMKSESAQFGFVGYNNGNMFIALFENCPHAKAERFVKRVREKIAESDIQDEQLDFIYSIAESTQTGIFEIRQLLKTAIDHLHE